MRLLLVAGGILAVAHASAKRMTSLSPLVPDLAFTQLADETSLAKTVAALEAKKYKVIVADSSAAATEAVLDLLPEGAKVITNGSKTLDQIGFTAAFDASTKGIVNLKQKIYTMDRYGCYF
jgi:hypothetical protein